MNHDFRLYIDGEPIEYTDPETERFQIERDLDGEGIEYTCGNCSEQLNQEIARRDGKTITRYVHSDGSHFCLTSEHHGEDMLEPGGRMLDVHLRETHEIEHDHQKRAPELDRMHDDEHDDEIAKPQRIPFSWANNAAISLDESDDSITVSISVGDPRGAFAFTIRRIPDDADNEIAGRLIMHVPYPGESFPHEKLTSHHEGTYLIG